ncbi:MAG TPA: SUF system Fe-S cluster assembly protein [Azospirillaceae bacterium]|nr:SUF system Fe-S cluster assembly protein [Azospirillaceae bacterium]
MEIPEDQKLPPDAPLQDRIVEALKTVYDPEIPVDIYELGLVYRCEVDAEGDVEIEMTLTAPGCPVAGEMPGTVQQAVQSVPGVRSVKVDLVWEPAWHQGLMSDEARVALNMF